MFYNTEDIPELLTSIDIEVKEDNPDYDPNGYDHNRKIVVNKTLNLKDYPEVLNEWKRFIDSKWFKWAELQKGWQAVQEVYGKLFEIHQEQLNLPRFD